MSDHVGYAGRKYWERRFEGDSQEVELRMSADCAMAIMGLLAFTSRATRGKMAPELQELEDALRELGFV